MRCVVRVEVEVLLLVVWEAQLSPRSLSVAPAPCSSATFMLIGALHYTTLQYTPLH